MGKPLKILAFVFGGKPKIVFKRVMILIITLLIGFMLAQNISFKFKLGSFEFSWNQAAEIKIER